MSFNQNESGIFLDGPLLPDPSIDPESTTGLTIVGQAQAGKTTTTKLATRIYRELVPGGEVLPFTNSNGFRGLALQILRHGGSPLDMEVEADIFHELAEDFARTTSVPDRSEQLDALYLNPPAKQFLRSPAVDSTVPLVAEDSLFRPEVNAAGARFLSRVLEDPSLQQLDQRPGLVVLDARNAAECNDKFARAGVRSLGTVVLVCPEDVIARRKLPEGTSEEAIAAEAERLRLRNAADRSRETAPMTLPEDLETPLDVYELLESDRSGGLLLAAGKVAASDREAGIVVPTNKIDETAANRVLHKVMAGMFKGMAEQRIMRQR